MNRALKFLAFVLLAAVLATSCSKQAGKPITQIIAFGNEFADIGAGQRITTKDVENKVTDAFIIPASPLYWQGRWSNGPLAVEVLAQQLGVKLTSYAVFGAFSGSWNLIELSGGAGINDTGLQSQIRQFKTELNGKEADSDALYYIVMTRNDFWAFSEDYGVSRISILL